MNLYPEIEAYATGYLDLSHGHSMYYECSGNPQGHPVVILHGGPGGSLSPMSRQFFDPDFYHIIQYDQRGAGKSLPHASLDHNTTPLLVEDMEVLRNHLGIDSWLVMGGSWGTTLALHYAIAHPDRVKGLILRGIFLGRQEDTDWLYQKGASDFFPDNFQAYLEPIAPEDRGDLVAAYYKLLTSPDPAIQLQAAKAWADWENGLVKLIPSEPAEWTPDQEKAAMSLARMECHYFYNHCFVEDDNYILNHAKEIAHLPVQIVHGRYDVDCRPSGAWQLHQALPGSKLVFAQAAGHSQSEETIMEALCDFAQEAKKYFG